MAPPYTNMQKFTSQIDPAVERVWRENRCLTESTIALYRMWVRRFVEHCRTKNLEIYSQLTANTGMFRYFSFVTLTTLGYGDILPVSPIARSLATSEALFGQLYPAVMIARLISLEILDRRRRSPAD